LGLYNGNGLEILASSVKDGPPTGKTIAFFSGSGFVGIGTTNPTCSLDVYSLATDDQDILRLKKNPNDKYIGIVFQTFAGRTAAIRSKYIDPAATTETYLSFHTNAFGANDVLGTEVMRMTGNGLVGIGTTNPTANLDVNAVNGTSANTALLIEKSGTTYLQIRGDGYVGIGAAPSTNGKIQITSPDTNTAHFSLTNGISNANASNAYSFRGWWGVYYNSPSFNGGTSGLYYIQMYQ
jgi:hypothetical protein